MSQPVPDSTYRLASGTPSLKGEYRQYPDAGDSLESDGKDYHPATADTR